VGSKVDLDDLKKKISSNTASNILLVIINMTMLQRFEILSDYFKEVRSLVKTMHRNRVIHIERN
jgi:hypothetical protein